MDIKRREVESEVATTKNRHSLHLRESISDVLMQLLESVHDVIACVAVEALDGDETHRLPLDIGF
jgi:hypothetical protein